MDFFSCVMRRVKLVGHFDWHMDHNYLFPIVIKKRIPVGRHGSCLRTMLSQALLATGMARLIPLQQPTYADWVLSQTHIGPTSINSSQSWPTWGWPRHDDWRWNTSLNKTLRIDLGLFLTMIVDGPVVVCHNYNAHRANLACFTTFEIGLLSS